MKCCLVMGLALVLLAGSLDIAAAKPGGNPVVAGNNAFACDLYANLASAKGNLFFSPYSLSTALAMTYAGARGQTATEMAHTLHFPANPPELHPALARLLRDIDGRGKDRAFEMYVANALWGQKGYAFRADFLKLLKANYGAGLREVDFVQAPDAARQAINHWVAEQTKNRIKDLIQPNILNFRTRLVLTNAIYFKAPWQMAFSEAFTEPGEFHVTTDQKTKVPMMHRAGGFKYLDGGNFQLLEMPYKGLNQSMVVLLPKANDGLAEFERNLTAQNLESWLTKSRQQPVDVAFPKFKITREFELNKTLAAMGMPLAFSDRADFSGMDGRQDLFISNVIHKAFVDVNEKGTEAAAATGVVMTLKSAPPQPKLAFKADHPFIFLIRDNHSGSILFLGRLTNPQA